MHKIIIAAALLLSGCGPGQFFSPEARQARLNAAQAAEARATEQRRQYEASPHGQAVMGCQLRARIATAGRESRRLIDLEGEAIAGQIFNDCMRYHAATGRLP
jgi:hypothetical protein